MNELLENLSKEEVANFFGMFERIAKEQLSSHKPLFENTKACKIEGLKKYFNIHCWINCYPGLVTRIIDPKTIEVMELDTIADCRTADGEGHPECIIYPNFENGTKRIFTLRKNGKWVERGHTLKNGFCGVMSDTPRYYYDWSF